MAEMTEQVPGATPETPATPVETPNVETPRAIEYVNVPFELELTVPKNYIGAGDVLKANSSFDAPKTDDDAKLWLEQQENLSLQTLVRNHIEKNARASLRTSTLLPRKPMTKTPQEQADEAYGNALRSGVPEEMAQFIRKTVLESATAKFGGAVAASADVEAADTEAAEADAVAAEVPATPATPATVPAAEGLKLSRKQRKALGLK